MESFQSKFTLNILNYASFLQYQRFIMPISFLFYLYNGLNFSDFIFFQAIFNVTCLLTKIPMGFLGDIFSKKIILIISYVLFLLRVLIWICFSGYVAVLAGEILYGLFKALYRGNIDSYIYEFLKLKDNKSKMTSRYGKLSFYTSIGSAVSALVGCILFKFYNFKIILMIELVLQIIALSLLFLIPDIKSSESSNKDYLKTIYKSIVSLIKNKKINFYVYYSAMLTGITNILVWNFQPLMKATGVPVVIFWVVNFINQSLRGLGALCASKVATKLKNNIIVIMEYSAVILAFAALIMAQIVQNKIFTIAVILFVCLVILLFVMFNVFTISIVHKNTDSYNRVTTSSTNTFLGDLSSFIFLLLFKYLYDFLGVTKTLLIFGIAFTILLYPVCIKKLNQVNIE